MKFSKITWIVLLVCILVFCAAGLGWVYSQQSDQLKKLNTQLVTAQKKLAQIKLDDLNQQKDQLTLQIQQLNDQLASNKTRLRSKEDSIDVTKTILELAKSYRIEVTEIRSPGLSNEELAGTNLSTLTIDLVVNGEINDISNFAISLNERYPTSIDTVVQLNRGDSKTAEEPETEPIIPPENTFGGTISLIIYNFQGN
jgi:hypothetical protein